LAGSTRMTAGRVPGDRVVGRNVLDRLRDALVARYGVGRGVAPVLVPR